MVSISFKEGISPGRGEVSQYVDKKDSKSAEHLPLMILQKMQAASCATGVAMVDSSYQ